LITTLIFDGCPLIVAIVVVATSETSRGAITGGDKETREQHLIDAPESSSIVNAFMTYVCRRQNGALNEG
jgi:hypothetical protein